MLIRKLVKLKIRFKFFLKKLKDWMVLLKRKILNSEIWLRNCLKSNLWTRLLVLYKKESLDWSAKILKWVVKFKLLKRILDFQLIKIKRSCKNSNNTREESNKTTNKVNNSNKRFRNCWIKIPHLEMKLETLNKISDYQLLQWPNWKLS